MECAADATIQSRMVTVGDLPGRDNRHKCPYFLNIMMSRVVRQAGAVNLTDYVK